MRMFMSSLVSTLFAVLQSSVAMFGMGRGDATLCQLLSYQLSLCCSPYERAMFCIPGVVWFAVRQTLFGKLVMLCAPIVMCSAYRVIAYVFLVTLLVPQEKSLLEAQTKTSSNSRTWQT